MVTNNAFVRVFRTRFIALLSLLPLCALVAFGYARDGERINEHWVATWSTTLTQPEVIPGLSNAGFNNQTLRQIVHTSIGGRRVRVRLSTFGAGGLVVGSAHIALSAGGAAVVSGSDRVLTFGRNPSMTIPSGAPVLSDPVDLTVPEAADLAITLFLPGVTGPATWHFDARQTSYISPSGNFTTSGTMPLDPVAPAITSWFWIAGVDVLASRESGAIAALGESVTDGDASTVDANHRWPDYLARQLMNSGEGPSLSVLNEGLDGNRLLHDDLGPNGLSRFERDVLDQPGLAYVIVLAAANDIGTGWPGGIYPDQEVSADQIIQAFRQLIARAHTKGLKIFGGTIMPTKGFLIPGTQFPVYSPGNEAKRQQVNSWIRRSHEFDGVIDFDRVLRDPDDPARLLPRYDSGDHAHPTDEGYEVMANAIDLRLFRKDERH